MPWRGPRALVSHSSRSTRRLPRREPFSRPHKRGARCRSIRLSTPTILNRSGSSVRPCASPSTPPHRRVRNLGKPSGSIQSPTPSAGARLSMIGSSLTAIPMIGSRRPVRAPPRAASIGSRQRKLLPGSPSLTTRSSRTAFRMIGSSLTAIPMIGSRRPVRAPPRAASIGSRQRKLLPGSPSLTTRSSRMAFPMIGSSLTATPMIGSRRHRLHRKHRPRQALPPIPASPIGPRCRSLPFPPPQAGEGQLTKHPTPRLA